MLTAAPAAWLLDCVHASPVAPVWLQGALLLLLFRGSHQLEHRLTEKAAGGLQRLFDSVPDRAVVVEVEEGSNAPRVATSQEVRLLLLLLLLPHTKPASAAGRSTVQCSAFAGWFFRLQHWQQSREHSRSGQVLPLLPLQQQHAVRCVQTSIILSGGRLRRLLRQMCP